MYRILILDDERQFINSVKADEVIHVEHSWDAIAAMRTNRFDEIWLDYDLGGDDKGSNVCRFIRDDAGIRQELWEQETEIHIHSFNPNGRMAMKQILIDAMILPYMEDLSKFELKPRQSSFAE